ncbi:Protein fam72a [Podila clonocystis]|nr:Protein fam72a [Podila clonocystis]
MPSPITNYEAQPRQHNAQSTPPPPPQTGIQYRRATTDSYPSVENNIFSDGSHNLRRSLNVAHNLSRLAEGFRQPLGPPLPHQQQVPWLNISRSGLNSHSGSYRAIQQPPSYHPHQTLHTTQTPESYPSRSHPQPQNPSYQPTQGHAPRYQTQYTPPQGHFQRDRRSYETEPVQEETSTQLQRPAFLSQPVYQLACAACIRPLCLRAMKAVMLSDHSKELYSTDMPPAGLQLVNDDRQVRHCACRIRDSACLGCGQVAGYHVTQPCSDCLKDQNNGHFWMFYSSAVYHYKRNHGRQVMIWANVPSIAHDQALAQHLRLEVPVLNIQTNQGRLHITSQASEDERPMTASVEMEEWLKSPISEVVCR